MSHNKPRHKSYCYPKPWASLRAALEAVRLVWILQLAVYQNKVSYTSPARRKKPQASTLPTLTSSKKALCLKTLRTDAHLQGKQKRLPFHFPWNKSISQGRSGHSWQFYFSKRPALAPSVPHLFCNKASDHNIEKGYVRK